MQHRQGGEDRREIDRHHHRSVLPEADGKEICRNDIHQIRHHQRQAGGIGNKSGGHDKGQHRSLAEPQRSQHGNHDWREDQRRPIVGKQRRHSRAEQDNPGKQQTTPASSPAGNMQRGPFEKARLIKQQADNDNGDKGGGRIPDDMPYHRDIGYLYATGGQRQRRAKCRAPADP